MIYRVYGGFKLDRKCNGHIDVARAAKAAFWHLVQEAKEGLSDGCGIYLFVMKSGGGLMPWYVGKAEQQSFKKEIFTHHKLTYYNDVVTNKQGTPYIYFIPRMSPNDRLCKPAINKSVRFLETLLVGMALQRNEDLKNVSGTALLKTLQVRGVINSGIKGHPGAPAAELKSALGIWI
jgi:hypothetical protein